MRLIDANALWGQMEQYDDYQGAKEAHDLDMIHRDSILFAIEQAPTVDAAPVVHGQFVKNETGVNRHCTACGAYLEDREYENHTVRFCYYCGAKMDGKEQDDGNG